MSAVITVIQQRLYLQDLKKWAWEADMKLLTKVIENKLRANEKHAHEDNYGNVTKPVVKYFNPCGVGTWLITDINEDGIMFGLCDLGEPELGYVALEEMEGVRLPFGLGIERDLSFVANKTLVEYADEARQLGYIKA